ncbi:MAG: peptidoglycan-binding domain-containing protein [Luteolibacter sp.]
MKQYLLPAIAGIFALSSNIMVAAPHSDFTRSKAPEKSSDRGYSNKGSSKSHGKSYGHSSWNDRIEVRAQMRLKRLGYYRGAIDGDFGRGSRAALVRFQHSKRLRPTGSLDSKTIRALGI